MTASWVSISNLLLPRRETIVKIISVTTGTSFVYIITSKFGHVGIYDDKLRLQRKYDGYATGILDRASNEGTQRFHNHGDCLLLVERHG